MLSAQRERCTHLTCRPRWPDGGEAERVVAGMLMSNLQLCAVAVSLVGCVASPQVREHVGIHAVRARGLSDARALGKPSTCTDS